MVCQPTIFLSPVKGVAYDCDGIFSIDDYFPMAKSSMLKEILKIAL